MTPPARPLRGTLLLRWNDGATHAVSEARSALRHALTFHGLRTSAVDDAVLAASELVGNAVEHAIGPYELWLRQKERELIVEMHDRDASLPCIPASFPRAAAAAAAREDYPLPRALGLDAERGRGLLVVETLTGGSWGFRLAGGSGRDTWKKVAWMSVPS